MASKISEKRGKKVTILDGGFSSQLSIHVGDKVDGDPLWTAKFLATNPDAVRETHLDFLRAGADIIQTNTYQASISGFMKHLNLSEEDSLNLILTAVDLAKEAVRIYYEEGDNAGSKKSIVGTVGPYGAALHDGSEYTGAYDDGVTKDVIKDWHRPRIEALLKGGIDLFAFETVPNKNEAEALIELLGDYPQAKAWISFSCSKDGESLVDGSKFKDVALRCWEKASPGQLIAVGVNCIGPRFVSPLFEKINKDKGDDKLPLVVYPNSGEQWVQTEGWRRTEEADLLENFIPEWLDLGVKYIGGCCRTYAKDITNIRDTVKLWENQKAD